jgi:hypothetical protein
MPFSKRYHRAEHFARLVQGSYAPMLDQPIPERILKLLEELQRREYDATGGTAKAPAPLNSRFTKNEG